MCLNGDLWLTLTYFMARSNLVPYAFRWKKQLESHLMEETANDQSDMRYMFT